MLFYMSVWVQFLPIDRHFQGLSLRSSLFWINYQLVYAQDCRSMQFSVYVENPVMYAHASFTSLYVKIILDSHIVCMMVLLIYDPACYTGDSELQLALLETYGTI